jgi:hypothetical protein
MSFCSKVSAASCWNVSAYHRLFKSYSAVGKHLLQYRWIIVASGTLKSAMVVAGAAHTTQKPDDCLAVIDTGFISKGFIVIELCRYKL